MSAFALVQTSLNQQPNGLFIREHIQPESANSIFKWSKERIVIELTQKQNKT